MNKFLPILLFLTSQSVNLFAQTYTVTDLGTLGGPSSYAYGINNSGKVVGYASTGTASRAVLFSGTGTGNLDLGSNGGTSSAARSINDADQVVGSASTAMTSGPILFSGTGVNNINLGGLPGGSANGHAYAINNLGKIVGDAPSSTGYPAVSFSGSGNIDLGTVGASNTGTGEANGVNDSGIIVGRSEDASGNSRATRFGGNGFGNMNLGTLGGTASTAYAINNSNQVVGSASTSLSYTHATLFSVVGSNPIDLGTLGGLSSVAYDISNNGVIVGYSSTGTATHGFIYRNGAMFDLNSLIPANSGVEISEARGINDAGQIAANGRINGITRALRLDIYVAPPPPAPVTYKISVKASPASKGTVVGGKVYPAGKMVNLIAKPKAGGVFVSWTEKGKIVSRTKIYKFKVTKARNLVANFR